MLGINGAAERQPAAELAFEARRVAHVPGRDVHWVEYINPEIKQIVQQRVDVAIRVVEDAVPWYAV